MKTSEANIEDLKGMVVSDGTMRSEDLIPKFLNVLKVYGRDVYDKYIDENPEVLDLSGMDDETMGWVVDELFDKLNEIAPEGYSFGSQDGDGACYGFWSVDADESKKCEDVPEIKVGDFVEYDKTGKEDWNWAEVTGVNEDGTLNLHITDMDKTNYDDVDHVPVASCHKLPRFAGMTDTGHYYMDGPINLYKGGWEICVTKKDLDPSKYEFIGTIDSYEDMVQVDAYYDDNYVYDEDDESEVREYFGIDFPEGAVTFADFKEDVVGESCVKGMVSEGWSGGFFSREDVLNAMDGGILNKDWKLEKRFGNWGCYVNQKTGRPLVMQVMVSQDRTGDWGYKPVTSDMGPVDTNIQAAKWLKPRLEQWASEDTKNAESIPEYEWHWIDKCLGKETANKDRKNLVKSLVKGDKIKLIDTVANGAVVTFIDMITPSKMRIDYNGREMSCKTSFIDHKVEGAAESKKCEAYIQPVTLYSTTRYDDAEAVQSFLRDIGGDSVTVDKQRNGDVLSVNVSGSDDDVEAFVDTYKNEYGSIVKDCEVDATGWTAPEDIYYIATEQGRKELRGESKKGESAGETMRVDVYADRRNFDPEEFVKYVRKAGGKNGGYISVDSVVSVDVLNKANRLAQANDYKRTESKKSEADGGKDIFTLDLTRIYADGNEEGLDDMQAAQNFYDEDEAIQAAKDLADSYKDDDDVVQVTVMAGEQEKPNGDIVGDSFDIFTASSSDSVTTAKYREKANYTKTDGLDYYAKGGKSESKKSEARPTKQEAQIKELCKLCRNDKNVAESVFKALTKDYNTSLDPVLAGQYLTATWKSKLEELGGCNGWYDGFKKLYAAMGSDFVCSVLQDLKLGSSGIGCGACITIVDTIYDKVVKRNEAKKSEDEDEEAFGKFEDTVKSILMDKYGVVDSHGPSDETANSLVLQYGATLRDAFYKGGNGGYSPESEALYIITDRLHEAPHFFDDCKNFKFKADESKKSERAIPVPSAIKQKINDGITQCLSAIKETGAVANPIKVTNSTDKPELSTRDTLAYAPSYVYRVSGMERNFVGVMFHVEKDGQYGQLFIGWDKKNNRPFVWAGGSTFDSYDSFCNDFKRDFSECFKTTESKKSESLTLKQKELKDMVRYGEAEDITTISDVEAKELKKKGIETVGISRGVYGMNGALLRDSEGKKYVITARSSNLFYFV